MDGFDADKVDNAVLALMYLTVHRDGAFGPWRAWKSFDWEATDRLHAKGLIADPKGSAKSVILTEEGRARSKVLFKELFEAGPRPAT